MSDTITAPKSRTEQRTKRQPPYNVILLDDDDHTYEYVIRMLQELFAHSFETAYLMAVEVDTTGRVIVLTTTKEHAELKRDQIHAYGPDALSSRGSAGSMSAVIEPVV
ncbi:MAG TPA: ATP-dependent Clp protease adaptor ClpS [Gemmataceae bacterium]|jgi:ATP-dependent Clp protease adaptor protein ClpS